jgi:hypothetical protein
MSQGIPSIHTETFVTGADMSTYRNRFLKISADNTVNLATAITDAVIGIQEDIPHPAAGAQVNVCLLGSPQVVSGAAYGAGAKLTTNATGKAVAAAATNPYFAIAIQAATAADELPQCKLQTGTA